MATGPKPPQPKPPLWVRLAANISTQVGVQVGVRLARDGYGVGRLGSMLMGMAGGAVAVGCVGLTFWLATRLQKRWHGTLPVCLQGTCRGDDGYEVVEQLPEGAVLVCSCGTRYEQRGHSFSVRHADGTTSPFMRRWPFGRWLPVHEDHVQVVSPYRR